MIIRLTRKISTHPCLINGPTCGFAVSSAFHKSNFFKTNIKRFTLFGALYGKYPFMIPRYYCSSSVQQEKVSSHGVLLRNLELALTNHQVSEAWVTFNDLKRLYVFPDRSTMCRLVTELCYSSEPHWLRRACHLVFTLHKQKLDLLRLDILTKLSISLARSQMPVFALMILRLMLEKEYVPPMNILQLVLLHMVKTEIGACLASNFLTQICDCFLRLSAERYNHAKMMKPDTMIFNLVLDSCVRFGLSLKGQQIIELMSVTGVIADAHCIIIIAQIHEMNGQRDELRKFTDYIDRVSVSVVRHYRQFYDSLLSLHFKFDDVDAAAELVLNMNRYRDYLPGQRLKKNTEKPVIIPIGSPNLRSGLKIQILPELLDKDSVLKADVKQNFVLFRDGKLVPSNKALAKIVVGCKEQRKIGKLSKLLLSLQREYSSLGGFDLCSDVINACIHLGWMETAHDILDDMELAGVPMGSTSYMSLLNAYYKVKLFREAEVLLKQMRKIGLAINLSDETVTDVAGRSFPYVNKQSFIGKSDLGECMIQEISKKLKAVPSAVYESNSSIYFFCKSKMIEDALKVYRRMKELNIQPTVQTVAYLAYGYSSLQKYRDLTILWGDVKRKLESGILPVSRDLYEFLLLNFLQGGYFERVMEVICHMKEHNMYVDKWMYKSEFLKHHKNLYRKLKESDARSEVQRKRLEHVKSFRRCVGIE